MNICIITFDTRKNINNILNAFFSINSVYAKKNNYDFIYEDNFDFTKIKYSWEELTTGCELNKIRCFYHKFELIEKYIKKYDYVCFLDSDACFVNPYFRFEDLINEPYDFFITQDSNLLATTIFITESAIKIKNFLNANKKYYLNDPLNQLMDIKIYNNDSVFKSLNTILGNPCAFNCGFMIFKNSLIGNELLQTIMKYYFIFEEQMYDQACIAHFLRMKKFKNSFKVLPFIVQGNPFLSSPFSYDENSNFIVHFYGQLNLYPEQKILEKINEIVNNKWWTKFSKEENINLCQNLK